MKLLRDRMKKQIYFRKCPYFCMQPLKWSTCKNNPSFFPPLSFPPHPFQFFSPFSSLSLSHFIFFSHFSPLLLSPLSPLLRQTGGGPHQRGGGPRVRWRANNEGGRQRLTTTAKDLTLGCGYSLRHGGWRGRPDPAAAPPPTHTGRFGAGGAVADQAPAMASAREGVGGSGRLGLGFFFENFFS